MGISIQTTNEVIQLSDGVQTFECTYADVLNSQIPMVMESKASLLQEINLDDMLTNLDNSSELIYIAFCALNGKTMQADLDGLQATLLELCAKSKTTMTSFRDQSKAITIDILKSYKWMRKGMVPQAKLMFDSTAKYAASMAEQSHALSLEFDALANQTIDVLKKVEVEHANEIHNKEEIENELLTMQAEKVKQDSLVKSLSEEITNVNLEYQEEKEALKSAEKKELGLGIASMITGALSLGLNSLTATKSQGASVNQSEIDHLNKQKTENTNKQNQMNEDKKRTEEKIKKLDEDIQDLQNQKRTCKEKIENEKRLLTQETDEDLKKTQQTHIEDFQLELKNIESTLKEKEDASLDLEKSLKDYTAELSGLAESLKSITSSLSSMQQQAQSAVSAHAKKTNDLLQKKFEMEKAKRESLAEMEKFAILIQRNSNKKITTDTAIQMLVVAIKCLKKVASSLIMASLFWESLKQYCEKLSQSSLGQLLDSVNGLEKEEKIEFFADEDFAMAILTYAAQWAAMYYVSNDYYIAANKTYEHTDKNFQSMPSESEAMQIAQQRSTLILSNITSQQRDAQLAMKTIEKQLNNR